MYGNKFTAAYGESPSQMWTVTIAGFKDFEIERGLRKLLFKGSGTPPTLPQFVAACKYSEDDEPISAPVDAPKIASQFNEPVWCHGQKCFLIFLWKSTRKYSEDEMKKLIDIKNRLVNDYKRILAEDDTLTGGDIRDALFQAWERV
jgi:hypothetical protein